MTDNDHQLLRNFAAALRREFPDAQVWAFGSRAYGNTVTPESDLDVCIVLDRFLPENRLRISDIAREVGFESEIVISTLVFLREQFDAGPCSASPLVHTIRTRGVAA